MIGGRVLDTSAVVDYATARTVYMAALVRVAVEQAIALAVPAGSLAQAWQQVPADARAGIGDLLDRPVTVVDDLDVYSAADVGVLLHTAAGVDVVTGQVAWTAIRRGWPVITADPDPVRPIAPQVVVHRLP